MILEIRPRDALVILDGRAQLFPLQPFPDYRKLIWDTEKAYGTIINHDLSEILTFNPFPPQHFIDMFNYRQASSQTLSEQKTIYMQALKVAHAYFERQGFTSSLGIKLDCRPQDIANWNSALTLSQLVGLQEISICDFDNVTHVVSITQYQQLCIELGGHYQALYNCKWNMRQSILQAETFEELTDIDLAANWPS